MLKIDYNIFLHIVKNIENIYNNKNSKEYKYLSKYVEYRKKVDSNYNLFKLLNFLKEGFLHNKGAIYKLRLY